MRIALGSDHAGIELRSAVSEHLRQLGHDVLDFGPSTPESVDYPHYAAMVGHAIIDGRAERGVLVCGTGMGISIAANKIAGVRAALCTNEFLAKMARAHNDANVLCLGQRVIGVGLGLSIVDAFMGADFEGGRHQRRVDMLTQLEENKR